jgi:hypothetical protein
MKPSGGKTRKWRNGTLTIGENKQPDLEWPKEDRPFVQKVEKAMEKHGVDRIIVEVGKITRIYLKKKEDGFPCECTYPQGAIICDNCGGKSQGEE